MRVNKSGPSWAPTSYATPENTHRIRSQSTILHDVSFAVIATVGLVKTGSDSTSSTSTSTTPSGPLPCDSVLSHAITILPDLPAATPQLRSDKQKEVEHAAVSVAASSLVTAGAAPGSVSRNWDEEHPDAPVPSYVENSLLDPGTADSPAAASASPTASTSATWPSGSSALPSPSLQADPTDAILSGYALTSSFGDGDDEALDAEEEYDGYEELSLPASLSDRPPPPTIDDDISPPSAGEPSSAAGFRLASVSGGVIDADGGQRALDSGDGGATAASRSSRDFQGITAAPLTSGRTSLGEPETPPPPAEYSLPFLPAPSAGEPAPYGMLPSALASQTATIAVPAYADTSSAVPSSPPPPLSPLTADHVPLPPFSVSTPSQSDEQAPTAQQPRQTRAGSDSLPPPYAGRETLARSPPAPREVALPELRPSPAAQPSAARGPLQGAESIDSPPPAFGTTLAGQPSRSPTTAASSRALRVVEESASESHAAEPTGREADDESRPPPYEQRDDGASGPSGIQWGMTQNRRGELVL